ncbi:DUF368 domain-containing protein [Marinomonas sp. 5E14-1]|uniref:DUF368 domain-containing protein n=1 Tax=Marinomonas sp. 5E14-1 TaxID=3153922 RepID=UPI003265EF82
MPKGLKIYLSGLLMGAADVVPGVSGGTIAFILGVYDRLISALSRVNKDSVKLLLKADFKALWLYFDGIFLVLLGSGILTSVFILAGLVTYLLDVYPSYLWSFFFGLILASAKLLINQIQEFNWRHFLIMMLGAGVGMSLSLLVPTQFDTSLSMVFFSGMVAICAMILPGISGSFLLLIMGMYGFILSAIKSFDLLVISVFSAGALIGLLSFSKILNYLLNRVRFMTLAALTGVMLGALVKVWPWKVVTEWGLFSGKKIPLKDCLVLPWDVPNFHFLTSFAYPVLFVLVGFLSVILISYIFLRNSDK